MTRRILWAIVGVTCFAVVALAVPLGVVIDREFEGQALLRLERAAILAERDVPVGWRPGDPLVLGTPLRGTSFGVYDLGARLVSGTGPAQGDDAVRDALDDWVGERETSSSYVIAVPIAEGGSVVAVLRAEQALAVTDRRIRFAWASMAVLAAVIVGASIVLGRRLARRIAVPIESLHDRVSQLGADAPLVALPRSGMAELDDLATALEDASRRVTESVVRERQFSGEVSHQLRTPLTGLRLVLDAERAAPRPDRLAVLDEATASLDRLEQTVDQLLALGRRRPVDRNRLDMADVLGGVRRRWLPAFAERARTLDVDVDAASRVSAVVSLAAIDNVLDVVIDNALKHGAGRVRVTAAAIAGRVAVRVADEGSIELDATGLSDALDERDGDAGRSGSTRIGLRFARRLLRAEGGELVCTSRAPMEISVILPEV